MILPCQVLVLRFSLYQEIGRSGLLHISGIARRSLAGIWLSIVHSKNGRILVHVEALRAGCRSKAAVLRVVLLQETQ